MEEELKHANAKPVGTKQVAKPALMKAVEVKQPEAKPDKAKSAEAKTMEAPASSVKDDVRWYGCSEEWTYKTEAPKRHVEVEKPESQEKWEAQPVQEKRKLDLRRKFRAGQKHVTPPPADAARAFYSSLLDEKPDSRIAIKYMVEHGVPHAAQSHEELFAKYLAIKKEEEKTKNSKQRSLLRSKGRFRDFRLKQQKQLRGTGLSNSALKTQERAPPSSTNRTCLQAARSGDNDRTSAARSHSSTTDQKAAGSTTDQKAFREVRATTMAAFAFGTATAAPMTPPESQTTARAAIAAGTATSAPRTPPDDIISSV